MEDLNMTTPPPELRAKWRSEAPRNRDAGISREDYLMDRAAEWSADQLLEACCETILDTYSDPAVTGDNRLIDKYVIVKHLRSSRRPKPPSLKEQALKVLPTRLGKGFMATIDDKQLDIIRQALEQLPDD